MGKLTPKQEAFCNYYIELGNATEAYKKAGYKSKGARANSTRLIANDSIKKYIGERMAEKDTGRIASQDEVLQFLTTVMRGEITEQIPIILMKEFEMVDKEPAIKDRLKSAEMLGKRYLLFTDRVEHKSDTGRKLVMDYGDGDDD